MYTLCDIRVTPHGIRSTAYLAMSTQLGTSPLLLLVAHNIASITLNPTPFRCGRHAVNWPSGATSEGCISGLLIAFENAPRRVADPHPGLWKRAPHGDTWWAPGRATHKAM